MNMIHRDALVAGAHKKMILEKVEKMGVEDKKFLCQLYTLVARHERRQKL